MCSSGGRERVDGHLAYFAEHTHFRAVAVRAGIDTVAEGETPHSPRQTSPVGHQQFHLRTQPNICAANKPPHPPPKNLQQSLLTIWPDSAERNASSDRRVLAYVFWLWPQGRIDCTIEVIGNQIRQKKRSEGCIDADVGGWVGVWCYRSLNALIKVTLLTCSFLQPS